MNCQRVLWIGVLEYHTPLRSSIGGFLNSPTEHASTNKHECKPRFYTPISDSGFSRWVMEIVAHFYINNFLLLYQFGLERRSVLQLFLTDWISFSEYNELIFPSSISCSQCFKNRTLGCNRCNGEFNDVKQSLMLVQHHWIDSLHQPVMLIIYR